MKFRWVLLAFVALLFFCTSCYKNELSGILSTDKELLDSLAHIEKDLSKGNQDTYTYCFLNESVPKNITLCFSGDISVFDIVSGELYWDDEKITDNIEIVSINFNAMVIAVKDPIERFNSLRIYDGSKQSIKLYTGEYHFEKISFDSIPSDTLPKITCTQSEYAATIMLTIEDNMGNEYAMIYPQAILAYVNISDIEVQNEKNHLLLSQNVEINERSEKMNNFAFEVEIVESTTEGKKVSLVTLFIPFDFEGNN